MTHGRNSRNGWVHEMMYNMCDVSLNELLYIVLSWMRHVRTHDSWLMTHGRDFRIGWVHGRMYNMCDVSSNEKLNMKSRVIMEEVYHDTLKRTATHCNTLQHTRHIVTHDSWLMTHDSWLMTHDSWQRFQKIDGLMWGCILWHDLLYGKWLIVRDVGMWWIHKRKYIYMYWESDDLLYMILHVTHGWVQMSDYI